MTIDLYYVPGSPPCRAVTLTAAVLDVELNMKRINLSAKEQMKPEFLKMNPQHVIPTINDDGFYLWESRAIMIYLSDKYAKNDSLYPKDPRARAIINQRLFFDMGTLYASYINYYHIIIFRRLNPEETAFEKVKTAMGLLDGYLRNAKYVAGDTLTLADLAIVVTISTFEVAEFDFDDYPNVQRWFAMMKKDVPCYEEANGKQCEELKLFFDKLKSRPMNE